ncbi:MAG TPA: GrpB family protein [Bacteroidia bacterium]|nr:GrpB family protein [Bacteroidia bacterium]
MKIQFEEYTSTWVEDYRNEERALIKTLDGLFVSMDHIGSTSVPGLGAKPIIDILVGLKDETYLDRVIAPMMNSGYTYFKKYETDMPYRRLFVKLKPITDTPSPEIIDVDDEYNTGEFFVPLVNIHVVVKDTHHWTRHIAFRNFLRTHPDVKNKYYELKRSLSQQEFSHHLEYNEAKNSFVKENEQLALTWFQNQAERDNNS